MQRRRVFVLSVLTALCAAAAAFLEYVRPAFYVHVEYRLRDLIARTGRTTAANNDLVFLAIDSDSVALEKDLDVEGLFASDQTRPAARGALEIMAKGWPWDREIYALILERLIGAGAKVVAFDCLFPAPASGDDAFAAALERYKSHVVIGSNFVTPSDVDLSRRIASSYEPPSESLIPKKMPPDDRVGFTNFFAGENNIVRAAQFQVVFRGHDDFTATYLSLSARIAAKAGHPDLIPKTLGEHLIRFTGPRGVGFHPRPIFEIFVPEYWQHNFRSGALLRDKIIVIGAEGKWQRDELVTPFGPMPGAEIHLNALNALLHREFLCELGTLPRILVALAAAVIGLIICLTVRSPWLRLLALAAIDAAAPFIALWFYNHPAFFLPYLTPVLAFNGAVFLCLVSDFTFERIERIRLRSTLKTRDDLTQMIVHDLRSPLTVVAGYMDALNQMAGGKLSPTEAKFVAEAQRGTDKMRDMITTLLDIGRLEAGQMPLRLQPNDIGEIARKATQQFAPLMQDRHLHCEMPRAPIMAICDADVVRRVLENLISNAIKFTTSDGNITVAVDVDTKEVTVAVSDDGAGIPPHQHERIFEKFGQTATGSAQKNSSGIGLAFCRLAIEAHGGNINVESEPGHGTKFYFTLPVTAAPEVEHPQDRHLHCAD